MKSKKILIINNGLASGGIERASVSLTHHFSEMDYQVSVLALYQSKHLFKLNRNIGLFEPDFTRTENNKLLYVIKMMIFARKITREFKPDTILAFSEWTNPYIVVALLGSGYPIYVSDRMSPLAKLPFLSELLRKGFYRKATGIVAQTQFAKTILKQKTNASNIKVIFNPVNIIEKIKVKKRNRIVSVGRLSKEKGHKHLIEAFAEIENKSWDLSLVGTGMEHENLEQLANQLGVGDRVIFHGHLNDFALQLSEAKIFVLPSLTEGFPNALIEAMSFPLACISSNCVEGLKEIVQDGVNALIFETGNVKELTLLINRLIENPGIRLNLANEAYKIRKILAFDKIAKQYLDFILGKR